MPLAKEPNGLICINQFASLSLIERVLNLTCYLIPVLRQPFFLIVQHTHRTFDEFIRGLV